MNGKNLNGRQKRNVRRKTGRKVTLPSYAARDKILREMGYSTYLEYRLSPLWHGIRKAVLEKHGGKCDLCGKPTAIVHHLSYSEQVLKGNERTQLVPICAECHKTIEFDHNGRKRLLEEARQLYWYFKKLKRWEETGFWKPFQKCCRCGEGWAFRGRRVCPGCIVAKRAFTSKL